MKASIQTVTNERLHDIQIQLYELRSAIEEYKVNTQTTLSLIEAFKDVKKINESIKRLSTSSLFINSK